ncbi:hypothetical protein [Streptomyces sp. NRRL F-5755]
MVFHVFATLAEFIRRLSTQGTDEGLDAARAPAVPDSAARQRWRRSG